MAPRPNGSPVRRVAITGAAGYVGAALVRRLERVDEIERVLAIDVRPLIEPNTSRVAFVRHDVTVPMTELLLQQRIDAVVHLAFVLNPVRNRASARRVNVDGTATVLDSCVQAEVRRVIYLSSTTVYGAHPDNPPWLTEDSPIRPVDGFAYGEDKAETEALFNDFTRRYPACATVILRACPVLGANADNFISRAFAKPFLVGITGCDPPMQFVHDEDLSEILYLCLQNGVTGVYNVAGDGTISWSDMVGMYGRRLVNLPAPLLYGLTAATWKLRLQDDSPASGLDFIRYRWVAGTERIKHELGYEFRRTSREVWTEFVRRHGPSATADGGKRVTALTKVIIDTDPGTDDGLALMMVLNSPEMDILGLTTVGGNASLAHTTRNTLRLMEFLGRQDAPVSRGAARPMRGRFAHAYPYHGPGGLTVRLPLAHSSPVAERARDFLVSHVRSNPREVTLIALGPLTNTARAIAGEPRLTDWIREIVVMGGAVQVPGNVTSEAEFNIYNDPDAAGLVFESGAAITLVGLDVCDRVYVERDDSDWLSPTLGHGGLGGRLLANWFASHAQRDRFSLCDPLAIVAAVRPDLLSYTRATVTVETANRERMGSTNAVYGQGNVRVATGVQVDRAREFIRARLGSRGG